MPLFNIDTAAYTPGLGVTHGISSNDVFQHLSQVSGTLIAQNVFNPGIVVTSAQILTLFSTPVVIIPAPGAGKSILIDYVLFRYISGGTAFASGGVITLGYAGGAAVVNTVAATLINTTSSSDTVLVTGSTNITCTQNAAVQLSNATGAFTTGNGSITIYAYYSIV